MLPESVIIRISVIFIFFCIFQEFSEKNVAFWECVAFWKHKKWYPKIGISSHFCIACSSEEFRMQLINAFFVVRCNVSFPSSTHGDCRWCVSLPWWLASSWIMQRIKDQMRSHLIDYLAKKRCLGQPSNEILKHSPYLEIYFLPLYIAQEQIVYQKAITINTDNWPRFSMRKINSKFPEYFHTSVLSILLTYQRCSW